MLIPTRSAYLQGRLYFHIFTTPRRCFFVVWLRSFSPSPNKLPDTDHRVDRTRLKSMPGSPEERGHGGLLPSVADHRARIAALPTGGHTGYISVTHHFGEKGKRERTRSRTRTGERREPEGSHNRTIWIRFLPPSGGASNLDGGAQIGKEKVLCFIGINSPLSRTSQLSINTLHR